MTQDINLNIKWDKGSNFLVNLVQKFLASGLGGEWLFELDIFALFGERLSLTNLSIIKNSLVISWCTRTFWLFKIMNGSNSITYSYVSLNWLDQWIGPRCREKEALIEQVLATKPQESRVYVLHGGLSYFRPILLPWIFLKKIILYYHIYYFKMWNLL